MSAWTIRSENLMWHADRCAFSGEASTLCWLPGMPPPTHIDVVSARTGAIARFVYLTGSIAGYKYPSHVLPVDHADCTTTTASWIYTPAADCPNAQKTGGIVVYNT